MNEGSTGEASGGTEDGAGGDEDGKRVSGRIIELGSSEDAVDGDGRRCSAELGCEDAAVDASRVKAVEASLRSLPWLFSCCHIVTVINKIISFLLSQVVI